VVTVSDSRFEAVLFGHDVAEPEFLPEDERAAKRLIKRYTRKRDWDMVRSLFLDLGTHYAEEEAAKPAHLGTGQRKHGLSSNTRQLLGPSNGQGRFDTEVDE
jgi:hypothetical protein